MHVSRRPHALQDIPCAVLHGLNVGAEREGREAPHEGGEAAHPGAPARDRGVEGAEVGCGGLLVLVLLVLLPLELVR